MLLYVVDEGVQGFNGILHPAALTELFLLIGSGALTLSILYRVISGKQGNPFPFLTTLVLGLPASYIVYILSLYVLSLLK